MSEPLQPACPDCLFGNETAGQLDRRSFFRVAGVKAATLATLAAGLPVLGAEEQKPAKPAEGWIRELVDSLNEDQKKEVVLPWDHGGGDGRVPTRLRMWNSPIGGKKIGNVYTKTQHEIIERLLKAICADDDGFRKISRNGTWDTSGSMLGCSATLFGELEQGKRLAFVFAGHHLTIRCPGTSEEGAAFGGPMFYGHSPNGYSERNVFNYQTKSVLSVFEALSEGQRKKAVGQDRPGEGVASVRFRAKGEVRPGISHGELNKDQQKLVETVMRDILSPYRKEDADEVMKIVKANGGLEKLHLAFYKDAGMNDKQPWHFWRLEGPGFVWNYRVLPHVHTYVNISSKI